MERSLALLFLVLPLALPQAVLAQEAPREPADELRDEEARNLFEAGRAAFEGGRFEDALDRFRDAYELSGRSRLLFNIGVCLDRLRRDAEAARVLEQYLAEVPDAPNRAEVEGRLRVLRRTLEAATVTAPAGGEGPDDGDAGRREPTSEDRPGDGEEASDGASSDGTRSSADSAVAEEGSVPGPPVGASERSEGHDPEPPAEAAASGGSLLPWVTAGAAIALGGVAAAAWLAGDAEYGELEEACRRGECSARDIDQSSVSSWDLVTNLSLAGAALAAAASVVLFAMDSGDSESADVVVGPSRLMVRGRF